MFQDLGTYWIAKDMQQTWVLQILTLMAHLQKIEFLNILTILSQIYLLKMAS